MAEGLNRVTLLGNLGADPELKFGQGGSAVLRLRMACTESWFDKNANERKERTEWVNVVLFGKRAEALQKILSKGSSILVEGRLETSSYEKDGEKRYSTSVVATNVVLTGGKRGGGEQQAAPRTAPKPAPAPAGDDAFAPQFNDEDDIPF